jgi:hypothetical protein
VEEYSGNGPAKNENITWPMRFVCWTNKDKDAYSECVILIAFPRKKLSRQCASLLCYAYIAALVKGIHFFFSFRTSMVVLVRVSFGKPITD